MYQIRRRWVSIFGLVFALCAQAQSPTPQQVEAARLARLRLLCVVLSGGDLTDPLDRLKFQRCLQNPPEQAIKENAQPLKLPVNPYANLVTGSQTLVNPHPAALVPAAPRRTDICAQGYVWRQAAAEDHVCVTPPVHDQTASDNAAADQRKEPGSPRCKEGFVWREAFPDDRVCVAPSTRAQAQNDNGRNRLRLAQPY